LQCCGKHDPFSALPMLFSQDMLSSYSHKQEFQMLLLISPAKKLDMQAPAPIAEHTQPVFIDRAADLVATLRTKSTDELASMMKISSNLAELNTRRFHDWKPPFDLVNAKQALFAFRGDVYASLDADSLSLEDIDYAQSHLRILSGLYGVLRPLDLMQAYRLEMGTRLSGSHGKDLYAFWGESLSRALSGELVGHKEQVLVNLASGEYSRAIAMDAIPGRVIHMHFKEYKDGTYRIIGVHAKRARGMMCRYAIEHHASKPEALQSFDSGGYSYRPELSTQSEWVFAR